MKRFKSVFRLVVEGISPKSKIQQFRITEPYMKHLVYRYGDSFKWEEIRKSEDIVEYVEKTLLPELNNRVGDPDHPKTIHFDYRNIDMKRELANIRQAHPEHYEKIRDMIENDPDKARKYIGDIINTDKEGVLVKWIREAESSFPDPVTRYLILKPVIDSTSRKDKKTPKPYRKSAVEFMLSEISENPEKTVRLDTVYDKALAKDLMLVEDYRKIKNPDGTVWIHIPGKNGDPKNYEKSVESLMGMSCDIWCISGKTMASRYLDGNGSFYLLIDMVGGDPTAVMAVRMEGKNVMEVRGRLSGQGFDPEERFEQLDNLVSTEGLDRLEVLKYVNKERRNRSLEPIVDESLKQFKSEVYQGLVEMVGDVEWDREDYPDFTAEYLVDDFFDSTGLVFADHSKTIGLSYDDIAEFAEKFDDGDLKMTADEFGQNSSGRLRDWLYGGGGAGGIDSDLGDLVLLQKEITSQILYDMAISEDEDKETMDEVLEEYPDQPYQFLEECERIGINPTFERYDDFEDLRRKVDMAYEDAYIQTTENAIYEKMIKHLKIYLELDGEYWTEDPVIYGIGVSDVRDLFRTQLLDFSSYECFESGPVRDLVEKEYEKLDISYVTGNEPTVDEVIESLNSL